MKKIIFNILCTCIVLCWANADSTNFYIDTDKIFQAGNNLNDARTFFLMGVGLNLLGTTMILLNISSNDSPSETTSSIVYVGIGFNITGAICHIAGWMSIGSAGNNLKKATMEKYQQFEVRK